jgi:hypothetical protein
MASSYPWQELYGQVWANLRCWSRGEVIGMQSKLLVPIANRGALRDVLAIKEDSTDP